MHQAHRSVLIVDADKQQLATLRRLFTTERFRPTVASSAPEALRRFTRDHFDVVVVAPHIGVTPPAELVGTLRRRSQTTAIIFASADLHGPLDLAPLYAAGLTSFLALPAGIEQVELVANQSIRKQRLRRTVQEDSGLKRLFKALTGRP